MNLDIKKAFKFPFTEDQWLEKLLVGGAIFIIIAIVHLIFFVSFGGAVVISMIGPATISSGLKIVFSLLFILLFVTTHAIPVGYILQSAHNEIKNQGELLPSWSQSFLKYFKQGIYYFLIIYVYLFVFFTISLIPLIPGFIVFSMYQDNSPLAVLGLVASGLVILPILFVFLLLLPFIMLCYAEDFKFQDAFRLDKILKLLSKSFPEYVVCIALSIAVSMLFFLACSILSSVCIGILLVPFLILPTKLIAINLFAQTYKNAVSVE